MHKIILVSMLAPVLAAAAVLTCQAGPAKPATKKPLVFPTDVRVERAVAYLPADRQEKADLYFPKTMAEGARLPAMVMIHGGGWAGGKRDAARELNIGGTLARNGYIVMSIDYLLADKRQAVWPTNLWDCKLAVRWLRVNAPKLGVDPQRIGVMGGSAGGHLAAMVALTRPEDGLDPAAPWPEVSCAVRCCIDLYGPSDLSAPRDLPMLGQTLAAAPEVYRLASPVRYAHAGAPPFLILHGTADKTVPLAQSEKLAAALKKVGAPHELVIVPGAPHTFHLEPAQRDLRPVVLDFLQRYLREAGATPR